MKTQEIRDKFIEFFKARGHVVLPASSLIPSDPSVLFTTAGMQQFKEWFVDSKLAKQKRVITIQPSMRTTDIEEVGDATHLTYFEMLGHFSFGDYFKKEAIEWAWEFITMKLNVKSDDISATFFGGEDKLKRDVESYEILKTFLPTQKIRAMDKADNFWGPTGDEGPCGPNVEFYVDGVEIWNAVFNEYYFKAGRYSLLPQKGVDMGGGLERIAMVINGMENVYETDEIAALMQKIPQGDLRSRRIIVDHARAANGLVTDGLEPSNKAQGAVLRRLIRRAVTHAKLIDSDENIILELIDNKNYAVVKTELEKFSRTLKQAMGVYSNILKKLRTKHISAEDAFLLQESYGLPLELLEELARKDGLAVDDMGFEKLMRDHRQKSRAGSDKKFKGGLVEVNQQTTKLHTAHHLLLAALRKVLGDHVVQRGSNISSDRLRIDFNHDKPLTRSEIAQVENLVNSWIESNFTATKKVMKLNDAFKAGALGEFGAHYPQKVTVYSIGEPPVSMEICGGPHVKKTSEIGRFKIIKEESSGAGIRRIKATSVK